MRSIFLAIFIFTTVVSNSQLYERSSRNMGLQAGYEFTSLSSSKKGFMRGESGQGFRIGYMRTFYDFIYTGIIFNYRMNTLSTIETDTSGLGILKENTIKTPSLQIPLLLQIPFIAIPLGKSKNRECTYLNTNFRIGPEFSFNFKSKSDINFTSRNEFALQTAFGFNVSKSGGTHRRMAWDVQWHIVWRKAFSGIGNYDDGSSARPFYNNYLGLTVNVIRYATSKFF